MKTELYKVIKSPYLTEKVSSLMGEANQYAFKVDRFVFPLTFMIFTFSTSTEK